MDMLAIHEQALSATVSLYHEFLARYRKNARVVYGFVEGKEDPSFYRGCIDSLLPQDWQVDLWPAGNKDKVVQLHDEFDWERYHREQVMFFMDRDLSDFLGEALPSAENVYITDSYSIENDIVNRSTCDRLLVEILNLTKVTREEREDILNVFEQQLLIFAQELTMVMVWIIHWRRSGEKPCLNDIMMNHLFDIDAGTVQITESPRGLSSREEYIHKQCNIRLDLSTDLTAIEEEFRRAQGVQRFVRGKFLLWFMVKFVLSVHKEIASFSKVVLTPPKKVVDLGISNAVAIAGTRARMPKSLKDFLERTCLEVVGQYSIA